MADGEWISGTMGDFKNDPMMEVVYEHGRPSYFQQKARKLSEQIDSKQSSSHMQAAQGPSGNSIGLISKEEAAVEKNVKTVEEKLLHQPSSPASSFLGEDEEKMITDLAKAVSHHAVKNEHGELINPYFGSEHPLLDPKSGKFSSKAWLETLLSIASRDPEQFPKRVAGVAYRNLSAHGFGETTDYQKTFGNYPFKILSWAKRLIGQEIKTRVQILRDFEGLVKSGEMLVVLGRPGRQVMALVRRQEYCSQAQWLFDALENHLGRD